MDARAQRDIVKDGRFKAFLDEPESVVHIDEVWAAKRKAVEIQREEIDRPVPEGWVEDMRDLKPKAVILTENQCNNSCAGGGRMGPTNHASTACFHRKLIDLFLLFWPTTLLEIMARQTNKCGNEDWVRPPTDEDDDASIGSTGSESDSDDESSDHDSTAPQSAASKKKKGREWVPCDKDHPQARHRHHNKSNPWRNVTAGHVLVWFGIP